MLRLNPAFLIKSLQCNLNDSSLDMGVINIFMTYFHYLIHPFKTHEMILHPERYPNESILRLSAYESLTTSWVFVIINSILRVIVLNFVLISLYDFIESSQLSLVSLVDLQEFPGLFFLVLSSILDVIFYPLFGIVIIHFWELIIRFYGKLIGVTGDLTQKAQDIMAVQMSSKVLTLIPFLGGAFESIASMILMYAGIRKQLHTSVALSICILLTPALLMLMLSTILLVFIVVII